MPGLLGYGPGHGDLAQCLLVRARGRKAWMEGRGEPEGPRVGMPLSWYCAGRGATELVGLSITGQHKGVGRALNHRPAPRCWEHSRSQRQRAAVVRASYSSSVQCGYWCVRASNSSPFVISYMYSSLLRDEQPVERGMWHGSRFESGSRSEDRECTAARACSLLLWPSDADRTAMGRVAARGHPQTTGIAGSDQRRDVNSCVCGGAARLDA